MNKTAVLFFFVAMQVTLLSTNVFAQTFNINYYVPNAQIVGEARLKVLFWNVYDATLYAPNKNWQATQPFALQLDYLRELKGKDISERAIKEMRQQGFKDDAKLTEWQTKMDDIFPDVDESTSLVGIADAKQHALFFNNGQPIGEVNDPEFTQWFFAIWLDAASSEPKMRKQLHGLDR